MPQPKLDTSLLDELAGVFASYPRDDMGLARIEGSAREMCTTDPLGGYMALGACAAVGGDVEAAIRHHEASIRMASGHLMVWCNYMTSLMILGESARVRHIAFEIGKRFRANPNAHSSAVNALVELGLLQSASQFVATFCNHRVNHAESKRIDAVLSARGLNEDDLSAAVVCARRFLAERGVVRPKFSCEHIEDDVGGPGEIAYGFHVQADPTAAHALECALLEYFCDVHIPAEEAGAVIFFIEGLSQESKESANADTTR